MQTLIDGIKELNKNSSNTFQFMRRGIVGSYKDELTEDQAKRIDAWSEKFLKESGVSSEDVFGF